MKGKPRIRIGFSIGEDNKTEEVSNTEYSSSNVEHPKHYNSHDSGIECIEVVRHFNFNIGNVIKYLWRHGKKDPDKTIEDLEKALFYLKDEINRLKKEGNSSSE